MKRFFDRLKQVFSGFYQTLQKSLFRNTVAVISLRGSSTLTRLLTLFLIARVSEPAVFGTLIFALAVTEIAKVVADFGVDTFAIREYAVQKDLDQVRHFAGKVAAAKILGSTILYCIIAAMFVVDTDLTPALSGFIVGLLLFSGTLLNFSITFFQAKLEVDRILWPVIWCNIASIAIISLLSIAEMPFVVLVGVLPLVELVNGVILLYKFVDKVGRLYVSLDIYQVWSLVQNSFPIAVTAILVVAYTRLDVIILAYWFDRTIVGNYGLAYRLTEPFQFASVAFALSVYSHLSTVIIHSSQERVRYYIKRYLVVVLSYGAICSAFTIIVAPVIIKVWLPAYQEAVPVVQILGAGLLFRTLNGFLSSGIRAFGYFGWIAYVATWNLALVSVLLWLWVPILGISGVALALLVAEVVNSFIQSVVFLRLVSSKQSFVTKVSSS